MLRHDLYYLIKPYIPRSARLAIRGVIARRRAAALRGHWPILERAGVTPPDWPGWPEGKSFAVVLTHDVEGAEGLAKVRHLAELEMSLGFRSSFNFVPEGEYQVPHALRAWLVDNGFEVGVHDRCHDGSLYRSEAGFRSQAPLINGHLKAWHAVGFRAGFMFHNLKWLGLLDILYDASTFDTDPFEPQPDGVETIFPFWVDHAPDLARPGTPGGYVELPYTLVQDSTLFLLLRERTPRIWTEKTDWIAARGGMALLNVHPDYIQFSDAKPSRTTFPAARYADFLQHIRSHHTGRYWHGLAKDLASYVASFQPRHRTLENCPAMRLAFAGSSASAVVRPVSHLQSR